MGNALAAALRQHLALGNSSAVSIFNFHEGKRIGLSNPEPAYFVSALAAACWKSRRTSLASLLGKFERCTIRT